MRGLIVLLLVHCFNFGFLDCLSQADRDLVLDKLNGVRQSLEPIPQVMPNMTYDTGLERDCETFVNGGQFQPYMMRQGGLSEWGAIIDAFLSNGDGWSHGQSCTGDCQIHNNLIFDESTKIGCALRETNAACRTNHPPLGPSPGQPYDVCVPACSGKECGPNGCSRGECSPGCSDGVCESDKCVPNCVPQCSGKDCGDDSCGGTCGTCKADETCDANDKCVCAPKCDGKVCGDDGCGGTCGTCKAGEQCDAGKCTCTPDCNRKICGDDGCGGSCGDCSAKEECTDGVCGCKADCTKKICGDDGCGGTCGSCSGNNICTEGTCACIPQCTDKECGSDSCGGFCTAEKCTEPNHVCSEGKCICLADCAGKQCGKSCDISCGSCANGDECVDDKCVCTPNCEGKSCGDNGCGGTCGSCTGGESCNAASQCVADCTDTCDSVECGSVCGTDCGTCTAGICVSGKCECDCAGKACGDDGCGKSCGECSADKSCIENQCACVPKCDGKSCGENGCGGDCGTCSDDHFCNGDQTCECSTTCLDGVECGTNSCGSSCGTCSASMSCQAGKCVDGTTPATSTPATSATGTSTPATSSPGTSTPATSTPSTTSSPPSPTELSEGTEFTVGENKYLKFKVSVKPGEPFLLIVTVKSGSCEIYGSFSGTDASADEHEHKSVLEGGKVVLRIAAGRKRQAQDLNLGVLGIGPGDTTGVVDTLDGIEDLGNAKEDENPTDDGDGDGVGGGVIAAAILVPLFIVIVIVVIVVLVIKFKSGGGFNKTESYTPGDSSSGSTSEMRSVGQEGFKKYESIWTENPDTGVREKAVICDFDPDSQLYQIRYDAGNFCWVGDDVFERA